MGNEINTCCAGRSGDSQVLPPAELCGYWFQSALAVEQKTGSSQARRSFGLPAAPDEGSFAWAIVHDRVPSLEWVVGEIKDGSATRTANLRVQVSEWGEQQWTIPGHDPLCVSNRKSVVHDGQELLVAMTVGGIRLHRAFAAVANGTPMHLTLEEATMLGWQDQCLKACLQEMHRAVDKRALVAKRLAEDANQLARKQEEAQNAEDLYG